jgi:hypothetical protein
MPANICHITDAGNLESILEQGGLHASNVLHQRGVDYASIAYESIQDRRAVTQVPCGPGGVLHDYVPFYFGPRSPMLYTISRGNVPSCPNGQTTVVHLVSTAEAVSAAGLGFAFTDGHAIVALSEYYDDLADLDQVDWPLMKARYWHDTLDDMDRKRRRQAEFLVHESMPWSLIDEIVVMSPSIEHEVNDWVNHAKQATQVRTDRSWYY